MPYSLLYPPTSSSDPCLQELMHINNLHDRDIHVSLYQTLKDSQNAIK